MTLPKLSERFGSGFQPSYRCEDGVIRVTLPVPPSANDLWCIRKGQMVKTDKAKAYQGDARKWLLVSGWKPSHRIPQPTPVELSILWFRDGTGDTSNRVKVVEDALQGWLYDNDDQVSVLHIERIDDANPRLEIRVRKIGR